VRAQETVLRNALLVVERERNGRKLRALAVGQPIRGEIDLEALAQLFAHCRRAIRLEIARLHSRARRRERQNLLGLLPPNFGEREWLQLRRRGIARTG
jgi:hypothetical protein